MAAVGVTTWYSEEPEMMLTDKVAVIYGAGGAIGGAVARAFAREGARLFLTGPTGHRSTRSPRTSLPPADPPRRRTSTLSTSRPSTSICSP
jgi:hypothetical protein